jgi:dolichyl-phosphate-mannose-protein mannosyltransferase
VAHVSDVRSSGPRSLLTWYALAAAFAVFTYFYGLDSLHIPKNGDEYPYEHITRMTAASGHWLPLRSEIPEMRNTKPPLLFWQGIVSTNWGTSWTLWRLRWPSVAYTLLTAGLVFLLGWRLSGQLETGFIALLTFLTFFSTYRYGRPFLTDAPSTFWLFVPCFALLWRPSLVESRVAAPLVLGLATGVGLLYKSFALLLPVELFLAWWHLRQRRYRVREFVAHDAGPLAIVAVVALAVFSVWFVLDPDPRAILNEFVFEENAGKFGAPGDYLKNLLWGGSSIWRLVVSYPLNAGLLMFPVTALFIDAFKRRSELLTVRLQPDTTADPKRDTADAETQLWLWVVTLFVVFSLPSQRDERYLLPAMPAVAVLCALNWRRIGERVFKISLVTTGAAVVILAYLSLRLEQAVAGERLFPFTYWVVLAIAVVLVIAALLRPGLARVCVNVAILLALAGFAGFLHPFDGAPGTYSADVQQATRGRTVWVPINFAAKEEAHRFLLPGADVHGYAGEPDFTLAGPGSHSALFAVRAPINSTGIGGGRVLGERLDIATRQTPKQILDMLRGHVFEHLFVKEILVEPGERRER